jgi:hypothetical protein
MKSSLHPYIVAVLVLLCGTPVVAQTVLKSIQDVKNSNIQWKRAWPGYSHPGHPWPCPKGVEQGFMMALEKDSTILLPLLTDPDRFIAAHALLGLSRWNFLEFHDPKSPAYFIISDYNWGPLEVYFKPDGTVFIDPNQMEKINKFWHYWRPRTHLGDDGTH